MTGRAVPERVVALIERSSETLRSRMVAEGLAEEEVDDAVVELGCQIRRVYFAQQAGGAGATRRRKL